MKIGAKWAIVASEGVHVSFLVPNINALCGLFILWVSLGLSLLSISLLLSRMTLSHVSCISCCNSLLAQITEQSNSPDIWFLVATSLATEKSQLQLNLQLNCTNHDANLMV
jgi:hypothetical protein